MYDECLLERYILFCCLSGTVWWKCALKAEKEHIFSDPNTTKILVTGGGSVNKAILQIIADVFNAPVYTQVRPLLWVLSISANSYILVKELGEFKFSNCIQNISDLGYHSYLSTRPPKLVQLELAYIPQNIYLIKLN